jgi:hypothetical protein
MRPKPLIPILIDMVATIGSIDWISVLLWHSFLDLAMANDVTAVTQA